ncbi:MAG TPA: lipase family protein [Acidimicrobiia bacterium]|nr:lipase family protein [Acidimicrobiia bacterium]
MPRTHSARRTSMVGTLAVALVVVFAGATGAGTTTKKTPAPKGLPSFYAVPSSLAKAEPGELLKSQKVEAPDSDGTVYRVMYASTSLEDDSPVAVTGLIVVPDGPAPDGGFPVVSWAHGTNGMADECAVSADPDDLSELANGLVDEGWLVVASDYRGEGTPGLHPYIAGFAAARDSIDIVRAAQQLKAAHASTDYVVWGHSQGGHTAMFAHNIAADYAPELTLDGVVAGAPPSQFNLIYTFLKTSPYKHYLLMAAGGLNAAYGDEAAPLDEVLTRDGIDLLPVLEGGCSGHIRDETVDVQIDDVLLADPFTVPAWGALLTQNDPQSFDTANDVPLLIIHGGEDEQIPTVSSVLLQDHLCGIGQALERWVYPGQSHAGVIGPSAPDMVQWITQRFDGSGAPGSIAPVGQADVEVSGCP